MKIGIVTYHRALNYGAVLQCMSLYSALKRLGHDVEVVDEVLAVDVDDFDAVVEGEHHDDFALGDVAERPQTRDKLKIAEAFFSEILVYSLGIFGTVACQHGEDIKFRTVFFHSIRRMENFEIRIFTLCINTETVALKISVKA